MKKPSKNLLLAYLIWCAIHLLIGISTLLQGGWSVDEDIWPFASIEFEDYYDIVEIVIYCGLPVLVFWLYGKIEYKYYSDK